MRLLFALAVCTLCGCTPGYERVGDTWGWRSTNASAGTTTRPLDLDTTTFVRTGDRHARDHRFAYFEWKRIPGADAPSFEAIDALYARDRSHVYFREHVVRGADPATFEVLGMPYSRDARGVYCGTVPLGAVDASAFEVVREGDGWLTTGVDALSRFEPALADSLLARGLAPEDLVVVGTALADDAPSGRAGDRVVRGCL